MEVYYNEWLTCDRRAQGCKDNSKWYPRIEGEYPRKDKLDRELSH